MAGAGIFAKWLVATGGGRDMVKRLMLMKQTFRSGRKSMTTEESHVELLSEIIAKLGLADVRAFGLTWEDCREFLNRLGYRTQISITPFDQAAPALLES